MLDKKKLISRIIVDCQNLMLQYRSHTYRRKRLAKNIDLLAAYCGVGFTDDEIRDLLY